MGSGIWENIVIYCLNAPQLRLWHGKELCIKILGVCSKLCNLGLEMPLQADMIHKEP